MKKSRPQPLQPIPGAERLYSFLPLIYRILDAEQGHPLRSLLGIIGEEFDRMQADARQLYDNAFIETCEERMVPYLGDLVGQQVDAPGELLPHLQRARVANALRHRRRKGRADTLEQALHEACGWSAVVVDDFRLLATTQSMLHLHLERGRSLDVRRRGAMAPRPSGARASFGVSVRGAEDSRGPQGQLNLQHVHVLLSRTQAYPVERSTPRWVAEGCYTFHALGLDTPLYTRRLHTPALRELPATLEQPLPFTSKGMEEEVAEAIKHLLGHTPHAPRHLGPGGGLQVFLAGTPVPTADFHARSLESWHRPGPSYVGLRSGHVHLEHLPHHPELHVRLGKEGPHSLRLPHHARESLAAMAHALEQALRGASSQAAFTRARVLVLGERLLVVPGVPLEKDPVRFEAASGDDKSVHALGLSRPHAHRVAVLISRELRPAHATPASHPLSLRLGDAPPVALQVPLGAAPAELAQELHKQLPPHAGWHVHAAQNLLFVVAEAPDDARYLRAEESVAHEARTARWLGLASQVAVDVDRGRLALSLGTSEYALQVSWAYGRASDVGAGPFPREAGLQPPVEGTWYAEVGKTLPSAPGSPLRFESLAQALEEWNQGPAGRSTTPRRGLLRLMDSATYSNGADGFSITLEHASLRLEAAEGELPSLDGELKVSAAETGSRLVVDGVQAKGLRLAGSVRVEVAHCTLLGSITSDTSNAWQEVEVRQSLLGPVRLNAGAAHVTLVDSLVGAIDEVAIAGLAAGSAGPVSVLERCTLLGKVHVEALELARDCLFTRRVRAVNRMGSQLIGCALSWSSRELPYQRCLLFSAPLEEAREGVIASAPAFVSLSVSAPGYGRLADAGPAELRTAAEDGGEPGVFHDLHEERRLATLENVLDEYLPAGLGAAVSFID
ncbi:hypothetical protein [Corallococcus aberystwythensis]|uniref:Uncharacterized protein n=1 Tax=Corallococcus aberystwythensis TaxID=2316722 RepID=A0A3A8PHX1_9BACT|nr:hypothetical protein [Corallococcus aberystwythensis]RKH55947.1 hypothetical protein D7W81_35140 [Corallococcus aberystwythensis]